LNRVIDLIHLSVVRSAATSGLHLSWRSKVFGRPILPTIQITTLTGLASPACMDKIKPKKTTKFNTWVTAIVKTQKFIARDSGRAVHAGRLPQ
jgi:hypothetical protein